MKLSEQIHPMTRETLRRFMKYFWKHARLVRTASYNQITPDAETMKACRLTESNWVPIVEDMNH
jgi:hypothetical protein